MKASTQKGIRVVAALLVVLSLVTSPGCIGRFALTKVVSDFNMSVVDDPWPREAVFLGLYIIPVYPTCGMVDLFIINSIEFWTDENPIDGKPSAVLSKAGENDVDPVKDESTDDLAALTHGSP